MENIEGLSIHPVVELIAAMHGKDGMIRKLAETATEHGFAVLIESGDNPKIEYFKDGNAWTATEGERAARMLEGAKQVGEKLDVTAQQYFLAGLMSYLLSRGNVKLEIHARDKE